MITDQPIHSFKEFWPVYVREHAKKETRLMHFVGTTAAVGCLAAGLLLRKRSLLALVPLVGYGPAWVSHFFVEGNRPASFKYPGWSLQADFVMWSKMVQGKMDEEVDNILSTTTYEEVGTGASPG